MFSYEPTHAQLAEVEEIMVIGLETACYEFIAKAEAYNTKQQG